MADPAGGSSESPAPPLFGPADSAWSSGSGGSVWTGWPESAAGILSHRAGGRTSRSRRSSLPTGGHLRSGPRGAGPQSAGLNWTPFGYLKFILWFVPPVGWTFERPAIFVVPTIPFAGAFKSNKAARTLRMSKMADGLRVSADDSNHSNGQ